MRSLLLPCSRLVVCLAAGAASGCAKGGGASRAAKPEGPALNEGAYAASDFQYVDPYPPEFHPLGDDYFTAVRTDEVAFLVADTGDGWLRDDSEDGYAHGEALPPEANDDCTLIDSASGDLDGDGGPELVLIGSFDPGDGSKQLRVRVLTGGPAGWSVLGSFDLGDPGEDYLVGRIGVGDVDGDRRDELIVAATHDVDRSWVRIYEDPVEGNGYGKLRTSFEFPGKDEVRAEAAQLDRDAPRELVLVAISGASAIAPVLDDALLGHPVIADDLFQNTEDSPAGLYASDATSVDLLIGDFDGDPREEIAVYTMRAKNFSVCWHEFFDDAEGSLRSLESLAGVVQGYWSPYDPARLRRGCAGDLDGDGVDEAIWLWTDADRVLSTYVFDPTDPFGGSNLGAIQGKTWLAWNLAVVDDDADGTREVVFAGIDDTGTCFWSAVERHPKSGEYESGSRAVSSSTSLVMEGEDFERDGTRVRWTGDKREHLPNPIPILVVVAPPTKAGISQEYDASEASYATSTGEAYSFESSLTESASVSVGLDLEDITGSLGLTFKASLKAEIEETTGGSNAMAKSLEFTGSHDHDVVIFEGTLHKTYDYEVVHAKNPAAIGTLLTINLPLETKVYKWTRELFEERFGKDTILPAGLLDHVIGVPESYPTHDDALALLATYEGFEGDLVTVGQGRGSNGCELALEEEEVSGTGWKTGFEFEAELKLGGPTVGGSWGLEAGELHETTTSAGTTYRGVIGDISDSNEYFDWAYDTGIFVYTWVGADDELPVQVLNFWVDPWGHQY